MDKEKQLQLIERLADRMVYGGDADWAMNIGQFDWVPGVGLYGIWHAWQSTRKESYLKFLVDWMQIHLKEAALQKTVNSTAPLLTTIELYKMTQSPAYLQTCRAIADYVIHEAPLTREGGLEHTVTEAVPGFKEQIWADTLFMVCIFLTKLSRVTGEERYQDFALTQLEIHHKVLRDAATGLYYHGWNCGAGNHMSAVHWGRANAWILYSTVEILADTGKLKEKGEWVQSQAAALRACQRENGAFGTILDDADSYDELSATAGIAAGLAKAIREGILDETYGAMLQQAIKAVTENVNAAGELEGVSTGTPIMPDAQAYKEIPLCPTLYGQGLAILALSEDLKTER